MRNWIDFWWLCFKWSYWRWEARGQIITTIITIVTLIGGFIGAWIAQQWWIFLIPLGLVVVFIAPYKLWKQKADRIIDLESTQIVIEFDESCNISRFAYNKSELVYYHYCMVLLKTFGNIAVDGVKVFLDEINPDPLRIGRLELRPRSIKDEQNGGCIVYPGLPTCYIEVASWDSQTKVTEFHFIETYQKQRHYSLPDG